jgi:hypothetical protein
MDAERFDAITKALITGFSRRSAMRLLASSALGLLGGSAAPEAAAHDPLKKCRKIKDKAKRKKCLKKAKKHNATHTTPAPPASEPAAPRLVYQCPGPFSDSVAVEGNKRFAQTFTPSQSGALRQIQFGIRNEGSGSNYVVQLLKVSGGTPGSGFADILATVTIPDATVASGDTTLVADFSGPALSAGTEYAAAIGRPGSQYLTVHKAPPTCAGQAYYSVNTNAFTELGYDLVVSVFVV